MTFGKGPQGGDLVAFFSARLDETGTDGRSPYVIVAGAVGTTNQWDKVEAKWEGLLGRSGASAFHTKEFQDRSGDFAGWSDFKCRRFTKAQERIIREHTTFEIAVAVHRESHAKFKNELRGMRGFKGDSDYGIAFRIIMFWVCHTIAKQISDAQVQFIVEDGPWAAGAATIYQSVRRMQKSNNPARYAHMLGGFASLPKRRLRSLEAADYLAGRAIGDLEDDKLASRPKQVSLVADQEFLSKWHSGVLVEKERRRTHGRGAVRDGEG